MDPADLANGNRVYGLIIRADSCLYRVDQMLLHQLHVSIGEQRVDPQIERRQPTDARSVDGDLRQHGEHTFDSGDVVGGGPAEAADRVQQTGFCGTCFEPSIT
jgi:hypothetical protein